MGKPVRVRIPPRIPTDRKGNTKGDPGVLFCNGSALVRAYIITLVMQLELGKETETVLALMSEADRAHSLRVVDTALQLALTVSDESRKSVSLITFAAMYHDIGKLINPSDHYNRGAAMLQDAKEFEKWRQMFTRDEYAMAVEAVRGHGRETVNVIRSIPGRIVFDANCVAYTGIERLRYLYKLHQFDDTVREDPMNPLKRASDEYLARYRLWTTAPIGGRDMLIYYRLTLRLAEQRLLPTQRLIEAQKWDVLLPQVVKGCDA